MNTNVEKLTDAFVSTLQAACRVDKYADRITVGPYGKTGIVITAYGDREMDAKGWLEGFVHSSLGRDFLSLVDNPKIIPPESEDSSLDGFFAEPTPPPKWRAEKVFTLDDVANA